jgi:hypothetical protein
MRGAESKEIIKSKILETFEGSFAYDKEIRIPIMENGELIQIKVTLTAAKTNVDNGGDAAVPGATASATSTGGYKEVTGTTPVSAPVEPTAEEKANVQALLEKLGLN